MKRIEAIVRPDRANEVKAALKRIGLGATILPVQGVGNQKPTEQLYRTLTTEDRSNKVMMLVVVSDELVDAVCQSIMTAARTEGVGNAGAVGDGKIIISEIVKVIRIRDGATQERAVSVEAHNTVIEMKSAKAHMG